MFSRTIYALTGGVGLVLAASRGRPRIIGQYAYLGAIATVLSVAFTLGIDRVLTRRMGSDPAVWSGVRRAWKRVRIGSASIAAILALTAGATFGQMSYLAVGFFVVARTLFLDQESVAVTQSLNGPLISSSIINGVTTGTLLALGSRYGAALMLAGSALGNTLAAVYLWSKTPHLSLTQSTLSVKDIIKDGLPYLTMGVIALAYQRADYLALSATRTGLVEVAAYSIVVRLFDGLAVARGAYAQQLTVRLLSRKTDAERQRLFLQVLPSLVLASLLAGSAIVLLGPSAIRLAGLRKYRALPQMLAILAVGCPLVLSHTLTTSAIFAVPDRRRLVLNSLLLAVSSIGLTFVGVHLLGAAGALSVTLALEWLSSIAFLKQLRHGFANPPLLIFQTALWPAASLIIYLGTLKAWLLPAGVFGGWIAFRVIRKKYRGIALSAQTNR